MSMRKFDAFRDVHLDPSCDATSGQQAIFALLQEFWQRLNEAHALTADDPLLQSLTKHLQEQLVGAALLLRVKSQVSDANGEM